MAETTAAGERRVRMKWTQDINLFIMRTFYQITQLETDMAAYWEKIHRVFVLKYPSIPVSQQRVADQRRTVKKSYSLAKYLSELKLKYGLQLDEELRKRHKKAQTRNILNMKQI
ncbi:hypothetical protein M8J77_014060 [Diaphorina citri]|nr:hypothetical protein M8J77_014060 [Diaphorina citri]